MALPILYSFRRCPYAMRARLALWSSGTLVELREVKLANKPQAMLDASPKGTVPVLVLPDGTVLDESLDIMRWALERNDPEGWLLGGDATELIELIDGPFKYHLDRYKYPNRYEDCDPLVHRKAAYDLLGEFELILTGPLNLFGEAPRMVDMATFPFVRQFANTDREWFDAQLMTRVRPWLERHLSSDIFAAIMGKYAPWQAGDEALVFGEAA